MHLASADPTFHPSVTTMWTENAPAQKQDVQNDNAIGDAEKKLQEIDNARSTSAWEGDTLKLVRDAAMCAKLMKAAQNNERTSRLAKITHLKEQNRVGASIVATYAKQQCHHVPLTCCEAETQLAEACECRFQK